MINDTIAAISTPRGKGGVALLRVSGDSAVEIAGRVFKPANGKNLGEILPNRAVYGTISGQDGINIDDGLAVVFRAPRSFTGEDTVEITCHGGVLVTETVLTALFSAGARPATAGEFTRRAFLNGKLGLSAAEALGNLLDAGTDEQLRLSRSGLNGRLSREIDGVYSALRSVLASVFAKIDYPDEDLADMSNAEILEAVTGICDGVKKLERTYKTGHAVSEGVSTVICGKTNAGKSSLYNRILGRDAAIVTDIAGTTRDVLEQPAKLGRVTLRLFDTAGLRETSDAVEKIGVERSYEAMESAELIIAVFDVGEELGADGMDFIGTLKSRMDAGKCVIAVMNKCDSAKNAQTERVLRDNFENTVCLSSLTGENFEALAEMTDGLFTDGRIDLSNDAVVVNARQHSALIRCIESLERAEAALSDGLPADMCCSDIEDAMRNVGQVDGREVSDDIVAEIFSKFCVGK